MKQVAKALREEDAKKNTNARVGRLLGVDESTVRDWLTSNRDSPNAGKSRPDARVKVNPIHKPVIAERVAKGESQAQVAADYGVSQQAVSAVGMAGEMLRDNTELGSGKKTCRLQVLGIEASQSHRWQRIASLPEPKFERFLLETREAHEESARVMKLYQEQAKERMRAGGKAAGKGRPQQGVENLPHPIDSSDSRTIAGKSRDAAGRAVGRENFWADSAPYSPSWGISGNCFQMSCDGRGIGTV